MWTPGPRSPIPSLTLTPMSKETNPVFQNLPAAAAWFAAGRVIFTPLILAEPFPVAKAFWANGGTVGTDNLDIGVYNMTDLTTGRCDLIRSTGAVLSAGASVIQETATWRVATANITSGNDSTDSATYTTASVTLKAGRLYLMSVANTAASADTISSITGGFAAAPATSTTQYNGTAHRVSIWYLVPTADSTGTLTITFGATQTSATWSLNEFSGVDTTTNGGIVQAVVGTGTSVTPLATLAAFGSANNATFGALSNVSDTTTTPGTGFTELSDTNATTPSVCLQTEWRVDNDTTVDGTITSAAWGAVAVELKADTSPFVVPANANTYLAFGCSGTTATIVQANPSSAVVGHQAGNLQITSAGIPLPSNVTPVVITTWRGAIAGLSRRSLIG